VHFGWPNEPDQAHQRFMTAGIGWMGCALVESVRLGVPKVIPRGAFLDVDTRGDARQLAGRTYHEPGAGPRA
jgi:hypothetical protein